MLLTEGYICFQLFSSVDELKDWAKTIGREVGVVVVTQRSKTNASGEVVKVWLKCDHGGSYNCTATVRRSGTIKTGCNFSLIGNYLRQYNGWRLRVVDDTYNHELVQHFEGHAYAGRLTPAQKVMVHDMYRNQAPPRDILCNLKSKDERNVICIKTVYNEGQKIPKEDRRGKSLMEVLFNLLQDTTYIHNHRTNPSTNALEDLFFVHPTSYMIYRAFPHVLVIDTTYNTNVYKMPFVQIVGVTSTRKTFHIEMAAVSNEKKDNFTWVLTMLKTTLDNCMMPRVILTDCDLALMNACEIVFPNAAKLLCRWHINENIKKHCRQSFATADKLVGIIDRIMVSQLKAIKATFEESCKKKMNHHNIPLFNELRRHVSCKALDILWGERNQVNKLMESGRTCGVMFAQVVVCHVHV
ncbi:protein FAR1-RELATED SEQUENCE 5-like [Bidens hawaiensis]|uniref:protein FAR1-RELATED SEQUENCE 5-like n=1 Tax=Bidens hawaiensis TaxID=980011 RepID=UPI00404AFFE4